MGYWIFDECALKLCASKRFATLLHDWWRKPENSLAGRLFEGEGPGWNLHLRVHKAVNQGTKCADFHRRCVFKIKVKCEWRRGLVWFVRLLFGFSLWLKPSGNTENKSECKAFKECAWWNSWEKVA